MAVTQSATRTGGASYIIPDQVIYSKTFKNFTPFPEIYGVPPMTNSPESDSILLDSLQYIFIQPGISNLRLSMDFSKYEPAYGKFVQVLNEVATESEIQPLSLKSVLGDYFIFAISNNQVYNTSFTNNYGPSVFEESVRSLGEQYKFMSQLMNAAGGSSMAVERVAEFANAAANQFADSAVYGLEGQTGDEVSKYRAFINKQKQMIANRIKSFKENKTLSGMGSTALSMLEGFYSAAFGRRVDISDVWQDSRANLTYNFNVELRTISLDDCVFKRRILEPLLVLMMLTVPRNFDIQNKKSFSFESPFLVSLFVPGIVNIEHGAITDLSISIDSQDMGLLQRPRVVRVSFTIIDLYQVMVMLGKKRIAEIPMVSKHIKAMTTTTKIRQESVNALQKLGNGLTRASMDDLK